MANVLIMTRSGSRYGSLCATCGGRIRLGRRFVIHPIDPSRVYHERCVPKRWS